MRADEAAFFTAVSVSRETEDRLRRYAALLEKWTGRINLIARSTLTELWTRHILDSAQLLDYAPPDARHWCDIGSGAGLPGLVIAILAAEQRPDLSVTLIEADQRKATFLRTAARDTRVSVQVHAARIEAAPPQDADILSARALAPLPALLDLAHRHMAPGAVGLFPKGARHEVERREALELWRFRCETHPSRTDKDAVIFQLSELSRA